jgi:hypothetical protein
MDYFVAANGDNTTGTKIYLKTYIDEYDKLQLTFVDAAGAALTIAQGDFSTIYDNELIVYSNKLNYIQTVEIADFEITYLPDRVTEIKVDKTRYAEIVRGGFLKAYYNETDYEAGGIYEGATPKKMTRILILKMILTQIGKSYTQMLQLKLKQQLQLHLQYKFIKLLHIQQLNNIYQNTKD